MYEEIDARGLACPQPVIMAKKAIETRGGCVIIVDNEAARDNVCRMAGSKECDFAIEEKDGGFFNIRISGAGTAPLPKKPTEAAGPLVVVFPCDRMGRGSDDLGMLLMRAFLHTLGEVAPKPDVMIFFNEGVKLTTEGSLVLDDLQDREKEGIKILVCGTCLDFFGLKEKLKAGIISNMYDIAEAMLSAGKVIRV